MSKSLKKRCIRRWKVKFKTLCDSKVNPHWRKHHLRGCIRECGITTADSMVYNLAELNAKIDFDGSLHGWSPEFSAWYCPRREKYRLDALAELNGCVTNDTIDEEIQNELEAWND